MGKADPGSSTSQPSLPWLRRCCPLVLGPPLPCDPLPTSSALPQPLLGRDQNQGKERRLCLHTPAWPGLSPKTPRCPPLSGPGASEPDAGDALGSCSNPPQVRGREGLHRRVGCAGWYLLRLQEGLGGRQRGHGCFLPHGPPSQVLGWVELTLWSRLEGESTWGGPGLPPSSRRPPCRPQPARPWRLFEVVQHAATAGVSLGRSWRLP